MRKVPPIVVDGVEIDADTYDPAVAMEFAFMVGKVQRGVQAELESMRAAAATPTTPGKYVDAPEVMAALRCSKSAAYRHLRAAAGRHVGTRRMLRVSRITWDRYARRLVDR